MTVYVDDMRAPFGRMIMCHMIADSSEELPAMVRPIGIRRKWCLSEGTSEGHYDSCLAKRKGAGKGGAVEITGKAAGRMIHGRRGREPGTGETDTQFEARRRAGVTV